jgi:hypothetical protein
VAAGALAPVAGGLAVGAGDLTAVPVDGEPGEVEATLVASLPATVRRQRTDQLDAVVGAGGRSRTRRSLWGRHGRGRCQPSAHLTAVVPAGLLGCGSPGRHTGNRRPARPRWSTWSGRRRTGRHERPTRRGHRTLPSGRPAVQEHLAQPDARDRGSVLRTPMAAALDGTAHRWQSLPPSPDGSVRAAPCGSPRQGVRPGHQPGHRTPA